MLQPKQQMVLSSSQKLLLEISKNPQRFPLVVAINFKLDGKEINRLGVTLNNLVEKENKIFFMLQDNCGSQEFLIEITDLFNLTILMEHEEFDLRFKIENGCVELK